MPWVAPKTDFVNGDVLTATQMNNIGGDLAMFNGGTTGQVLSKASNANGDFAWTSETDPNAIPKTLIDAKGDLIAGSAADTAARLAVGTNGQVLTADSTTATGLKWATIAVGKSYSALATATVAAGSANYTLSSISGQDTIAVSFDLTRSSSSAAIDLRINGDSGSNYRYMGTINDGLAATTSYRLDDGSGGINWSRGWFFIEGANGSGNKRITAVVNAGSSYFFTSGWWTGTATVNSIALIPSSGTIGSTTNRVYVTASA